jgi:hypothetical protein
VAQSLRVDLAADLVPTGKHVVFLGPRFRVPEELDKEIHDVDYPPPGLDELSELLYGVAEDLGGEDENAVQLTPEGRERLLKAARKSLVLRESATDRARYAWVRDDYLDPGVELSVHVNAYDTGELARFMESHGFAVERIADRRSGDKPEDVIGHPHWWMFFRAVRKNA